jgi:hypothetical protein
VWRHERDSVSLMAGLLLVLLGAVFLVDDLTGLDVDGRWVAPLVLMAVGAVGLLSSLRSAESSSTAP